MPTPDEKTPVLLKVYFDLPFVLFLKDSLRDSALDRWAEAYSKGQRPLPYAKYAPAGEKPGALTIGGGFPVYLPPKDLSPFYEVAVAGTTVGIRTLRRVNPHRSTVMMGEVPGDRSGRASFSSVLVLFDYATLQPELRLDVRRVIHLAIDGINHLIAHYRVLADRPYIRSVTPSEVQEFQYYTQYDDGTEEQMEYGEGSGPLHGFGGAIDDSTEVALRAAVRVEGEPPIDLTLDADIRNNIDLREWRLALIQSAILFEAHLAACIRLGFHKQGLDEGAMSAWFAKPDGYPRSATSLAATVVPPALGFDFASTAEFADWTRHVRDPRNDLVHGKRFAVSQEEAQLAYRVVRTASALLTSRVPTD